MDSEQNQDGWHGGVASTYTSADYSMRDWGDEGLQKLGEQLADVDSDIEKLQRMQGAEEQQNSQDPFDYTPWIAALPMPFTKEIEQGLRVNGLKIRKQIQFDLKSNPALWDALRRPASLHNARRSLAEMLVNIPQPDHSQFTKLGDDHEHMSLATMEKYLYPTLFLMRYLHERGEKNLPGGIESMITYSFFAQGHMTQSRTAHDLSVL